MTEPLLTQELNDMKRPQTRALILPRGGTLTVTMQGMYWQAYDRLTDEGVHEPADIIAHARTEARTVPGGVDLSMERVVARLFVKYIGLE